MTASLFNLRSESEKNDGAGSVIRAADGGCLVGGTDSGKAWVIKLNKEGEKEGDKMFGRNDCTEARSILETQSRGHIICGPSYVKYDDNDISIINFNAEGNYKKIGAKYKKSAEKDFAAKRYKSSIDNYERALKFYQKAGIDYSKKYYTKLALAYEKENRIDMAVSCYEKAGNLNKTRKLSTERDATNIVKRVFRWQSLDDVLTHYSGKTDHDAFIIILRAAIKYAQDPAENATVVMNTKDIRSIAQRYVKIANSLTAYLNDFKRNKK